jgi:hypothetical protein
MNNYIQYRKFRAKVAEFQAASHASCGSECERNAQYEECWRLPCEGLECDHTYCGSNADHPVM